MAGRRRRSRRHRRRDECPALVMLGLILVGDEDEAGLLSGPGGRLVIVADDEGDVGGDWVMLRSAES